MKRIVSILAQLGLVFITATGSAEYDYSKLTHEEIEALQKKPHTMLQKRGPILGNVAFLSVPGNPVLINKIKLEEPVGDPGAEKRESVISECVIGSTWPPSHYQRSLLIKKQSYDLWFPREKSFLLNPKFDDYRQITDPAKNFINQHGALPFDGPTHNPNRLLDPGNIVAFGSLRYSEPGFLSLKKIYEKFMPKRFFPALTLIKPYAQHLITQDITFPDMSYGEYDLTNNSNRESIVAINNLKNEDGKKTYTIAYSNAFNMKYFYTESPSNYKNFLSIVTVSADDLSILSNTTYSINLPTYLNITYLNWLSQDHVIFIAGEEGYVVNIEKIEGSKILPKDASLKLPKGFGNKEYTFSKFAMDPLDRSRLYHIAFDTQFSITEYLIKDDYSFEKISSRKYQLSELGLPKDSQVAKVQSFMGDGDIHLLIDVSGYRYEIKVTSKDNEIWFMRKNILIPYKQYLKAIRSSSLSRDLKAADQDTAILKKQLSGRSTFLSNYLSAYKFTKKPSQESATVVQQPTLDTPTSQLDLD